MHKTHIFEQKNNLKIFYRPTYPIFSWPLQETNYFFLGVVIHMELKTVPFRDFLMSEKGLIMKSIIVSSSDTKQQLSIT